MISNLCFSGMINNITELSGNPNVPASCGDSCVWSREFQHAGECTPSTSPASLTTLPGSVYFFNIFKVCILNEEVKFPANEFTELAMSSKCLIYVLTGSFIIKYIHLKVANHRNKLYCCTMWGEACGGGWRPRGQGGGGGRGQ